MRFAVVVVALMVAALGATAAQAGGLFRLADEGDRPNVAVDSSGTAHVVWTGKAADGDLETHYCRLPKGRTSCASDVVLPIPRRAGTTFASLDGPFVFTTGPNGVTVAAYRNGSFDRPDGIGDRALFVFSSTDGGRNFGAPAIVGTQAPSGDAISVVSNAETGGTFFQSAPTGVFTSTIANLGDGPSQWFNGSVGLLDGATPIVAFDDLATVFFRRYLGAGDLNDPASWTATSAVGAGSDTRLASGPTGVYLMIKTGQTKKRYVVRRYAGGGFARVAPLSKRGDPIFNDLVQDEGGRAHAVWLNGSRALVSRSSDGTSFWGPVRELVDSSVSMFDIELGAGPDGRGLAVWRGGGIFAVRVNPACANRIVGTRRADTLGGGSRGDHLLGLRGADTLRGRGGDDCIDGGGGADRAFGNAGDDQIDGGGGRDRLEGGGGDDVLDGGSGPDTLIGGGGADVLMGGRGRDLLVGGRGADILNCGPDIDVARAGPEDRTIGCETVIAA